MTQTARIRAYLVDDESLAIERLTRMLEATGKVEVIGHATDPQQALEALGKSLPDALFLDIQMPGMNGFELLNALEEQPPVVFTTAYDAYALRAFEVNSIDYLLKPVDAEALERALTKLGRLQPSAWQKNVDLPQLLTQLAASLEQRPTSHARRIATRVGERMRFLDLATISHFQAQDKLTYAVVEGHTHVVDATITELEQRLDPERFVRIHRSALVNVDYVAEMNSWFAGKVVVTLRDRNGTQLPVARERVRSLKEMLGC